MATQGEKLMSSISVAVEFTQTKHKWVGKVLKLDGQARLIVAIGLEYKCKYLTMSVSLILNHQV